MNIKLSVISASDYVWPLNFGGLVREQVLFGVTPTRFELVQLSLVGIGSDSC
jgi:hypothetical protein